MSHAELAYGVFAIRARVPRAFQPPAARRQLRLRETRRGVRDDAGHCCAECERRTGRRALGAPRETRGKTCTRTTFARYNAHAFRAFSYAVREAIRRAAFGEFYFIFARVHRTA